MRHALHSLIHLPTHPTHTTVLSQAFGEKQEKEAAHTYDSYARKYHGNDART